MDENVEIRADWIDLSVARNDEMTTRMNDANDYCGGFGGLSDCGNVNENDCESENDLGSNVRRSITMAMAYLGCCQRACSIDCCYCCDCRRNYSTAEWCSRPRSDRAWNWSDSSTTQTDADENPMGAHRRHREPSAAACESSLDRNCDSTAAESSVNAPASRRPAVEVEVVAAGWRASWESSSGY